MTISAFDVVRQLHDEGRYFLALTALDKFSAARERSDVDVVRAELLERVGRLDEARKLIDALLPSKRLKSSDRSTCELVLGRIEWEQGESAQAIHHIQESIRLASHADDSRAKCWAQLWLATICADRSGPTHAATILSDCRNSAVRLGDGRLWAALHAYTALIEARRGLLNSASAHIRISQEHLRRTTNVWLNATLEFTKANIAAMRSDFRAAALCGQRAKTLAEESGCAACIRTCYANLGFIHYSLGKSDDAVSCFNKALEILPSNGEHTRAILETVARIRLEEGSEAECESLLADIESRVSSREDRLLYAQRHSRITRAKLLCRQGLFDRALDQIDLACELAAQSHDEYLLRSALLEKAEILQALNRSAECAKLFQSSVNISAGHSPAFYARYEAVLSAALLSNGNRAAALQHRNRANWLLESIAFEPGLNELSRSWPAKHREASSETSQTQSGSLSANNVLQTVAAIFAHTSRPELVARGLIELLRDTDCVTAAIATTGSDNNISILASIGDTNNRRTQNLGRHFCLGYIEDRSVDIWIEPKAGLEALATLNALSTLIGTAQDVELARAERERHLTLWPIDNVSLMNENAIVNGRFNQVLEKARRVATSDIPVIITGESGVGKEIVARAVHSFSDRSGRPFVPFNCAALPRDMVESQLFGHRRGAFTGADRDNLGVIRAAKGGTLFLDEIGDLSIDLQPKLLRFLESGEICPLGETTPFTVDVRVVAATNAKLEQAVKDGRFREDLYYRLNGVRLEIPPLRERRDELPSLIHHFLGRAAVEFKKGHVRIAEDTMERLLLAPWPGNIRQLQNELRRMVALAEPDSVLTPASLSPEVAGTTHDDTSTPRDGVPPVPLNAKLNPTLERIEREMVKAALHQHREHMDAAAKALGISRKGLYLKRQRLGL